jgi:hypothetical protein
MKKGLLFTIGIAFVLLLSSCSHHVCPTYDNQSGEQKYSGNKKSKATSGLFPKNM